MATSYFQMLRRYKIAIAIPLIIIYLIFVPIGFNSTDYVKYELAQENRGQDQDVLSFTSLTEDLIFVIDGDRNLISQEVWDWTAKVAFEMQNDPIIQKYAEDAASLQHIFDQGKRLLSPYLVNLFTVTAGINVTTYMLIEGTQQLLSLWQENYQSNPVTAFELTRSQTVTNITKVVDELALGDLLLDFVEPWVNASMNYWGDIDPSSISFADIVSSWSTNTAHYILPQLPSQLTDLFSTLLASILPTTEWTSSEILATTSQILFGNDTPESVEFLDEIFNQGNNPTNAVQIAQDNLISFLRGEYLPVGFPETIRNFFLEAFTNSNGDEPATSMIFRMRVRENLTDDQLITLMDAMVEKSQSLDANNPFHYGVAFLSMSNYEKERSRALSSELHQIDLIALGIAFIVLVFFFDNIILASVTAALAFLTAQATKGIMILTLGRVSNLDATSVSMASTLILGAAMNYAVFFAFRYRQERQIGDSHEEAVEIASQKAIHSIMISGMAVVVTVFPYMNSSMQVLKDFSRISLFSLIVQLIILIHALPVIFDFFQYLQELGDYKEIKISIKINPKRAKRIIFAAGITFSICLLILALLPNSFAATDLIGEEGETGKALNIVETNYPENYLSKVLIQIHFDEIIREGDNYDPNVLNTIESLSRSIMEIDTVEELISISRPIGERLDLNNESLSLVSRESALIVADQLIDETNKVTFIIIQLTISSTSDEVVSPMRSIVGITDKFADNNEAIESITYTGLPVETLGFYSHMSTEVPIQLLIAIIFLTLFLWWQLGSISVPIRLELTIIFATVLAITTTAVFWVLFTGQPLNAIVIVTVFLILLGIGTDFDIYIYRRILEELEAGESLVNAINTAIEKSGVAVIVSGLVMAVTFLSLLASDIVFVRQFGFVTFVTILIDILLVRTVLVPAILMIFSPHIKEEE